MTTTHPNHTISILSPGRICLFGDHQDYLELPVIACAIDRYIRLRATPNNRNVFHILMPDLEIERTIDYSSDEVSSGKRDYFLSALRVLKRNGIVPNRGYDISILGNIPINAGLSSSSALVVAWVRFLHEAFGNGATVSSEQIARQTYEAEVVEYNEPGGLMDQYTISLGNVLMIDTRQPVRFETLSNSLKGLVIGESGIPKETLGVLGGLRALALESIDWVRIAYPGFSIQNCSLKEADKFVKAVPDDLKPYFLAAVENHHITKSAVEELRRSHLDLEKIGKLMTQHHNVLRDKLGVTVPKIDKMIRTVLQVGAFGAKIVGSGGGGCIVALCPKERKEAVIEALKNSESKAYKVSVDEGARVIRNGDSI